MTSAVRWLLLPVEVKARGLEGRVFLGAHAVARGWKVVVGRKNRLNGAVRDLPRGLYFDKSIQSLALGQIRYIRALGNTYAAIDEEGLVHEGGAAAYVKRRFNHDTLAETRAFCCWGDAQAEVVRDAQPDLADRVVVTGNPRVDLWRPEMHALHRRAVDEIRADVGRFVLVPSNFANVIGADGPERTARFGEITGHYGDPAERARFARYLGLRSGILDRLGPALVTLARSLPDGHSVVVRPHPSEDHAHWERLAADEPRIVVRFEGPLTPWLLAADCVVHSNCTSGVEAAVAGVPAIAYAPLDEHDFPMLPNQVSQVVEGDEALVDAVAAAVAGRPLAPESARATVDHNLAAVRGPMAAERMVALFDTLPVREDRGDGRRGHRRTDDARTLPGRARRWAERRGTRAVELPSASPTLVSQKFPPTPLAEVADFVARLGEVDPRLADVRVRELAPDLFQLEAAGG
jgi:surface carbohydrate biosynthesis protein